MSNKFHRTSLDTVVDEIFERQGIWCGTCRQMRLERLLESGILARELIGDPYPEVSQRIRHIREEATSEDTTNRLPDTDETSDEEEH